MYICIYKATEIAAKISQNTRNAWLIWRAYKVALWLEMRLSLPLTPSLCVSLSVCLSLGFSPPFAYCIVYDISPALFFRSQRHFCVTRRIAETFSSEVSLSFLFVSCCFSAIAVSVVLCCVVLCGSHLYKQTDYHFMLLLSAEHALLSRCVWLTQRATSDTRQWVKMPMHFHLHYQSSSLSSSPSHCLSVCLSLSASFAVTSPF